ncbi:MAG: hypothetical protein VKL59_22790, partial [Nostocaceae cyanobacterium]|nr:hypothetical protein [Nostocaceae cyanobacterium]
MMIKPSELETQILGMSLSQPKKHYRATPSTQFPPRLNAPPKSTPSPLYPIETSRQEVEPTNSKAQKLEFESVNTTPENGRVTPSPSSAPTNEHPQQDTQENQHITTKPQANDSHNLDTTKQDTALKEEDMGFLP